MDRSWLSSRSALFANDIYIILFILTFYFQLTGYSLELYDKKALDEVFIKLNEIMSIASGTALTLIKSVINLRTSHWGYDSSVTSSRSR